MASADKHIDALSPEDCVRGAEAAKEAGNALLRRGANDEALAKYRSGLNLCSLYQRKVRLKAKNKDLQQRATAVFLALHLNAAQVSLKLCDWASAGSHADTVLQVDRRNLKALYRRGVARSYNDTMLEKACEDFSRVLELEPSNKEAAEQLLRVQDLVRTFYDLLGVHPEATTSQIRHAYLREAKRWHPDKAADEDKELADRRFKVIAEAHDVLKDDKMRQHYDLYLQCRQYGYCEFDDPEGGSIKVPFQDWNDLKRLLEPASTDLVQEELSRRAGRRGYRQEEAPEVYDPDDTPLSVTEWLVAGTIVLAISWFFTWRHSHRQWLKAMPLSIWTVHEEYSLPMGLLMSPLFFGNVPFEEAARWMQSMVREALAF